MIKPPEKEYMGDAVMAEFDGYQIILRTEDGNNNIIYMEPEVANKLKKYIEEVQLYRATRLEELAP